MAGVEILAWIQKENIPKETLDHFTRKQKEILAKVFQIIKAKRKSQIRFEIRKKGIRFKSFDHKPERPKKLIIETWYKEHHEKVKESEKLANKLRKEAFQRSQRQKERDKEESLKIAQEEAEAKLRETEKLKHEEEQRVKRLQEIHLKSENRKKEFNSLQEISAKEYLKVISEPPLYEKIHQNFKNEILFPELEKQKAELAKRKVLFKPLDHTELDSFFKRHEEFRKEKEIKRIQDLKHKSTQHKINSSNLSSKSIFTAKVIEDDKLLKEAQDRNKYQKKL